LKIYLDRPQTTIQAAYYLRHLQTRLLRPRRYHLLSHFDITAEDGATDNNELLTVDQLVIKSLTITANENDYVKVSASFQGMIDTRAASDYSVPDEDHVLGRSLTWGDCDASRYESSLRTVSSFEITIENELETLSFLMAGDLAGAENPYKLPVKVINK
jgi:hypothetical protein